MYGENRRKSKWIYTGRSCVNNLHIIQQLIEESINQNHELILSFISLEKAYESTARRNLWTFVEYIAINGKILKILKKYNSDVKIGNESSDLVEITKGFRQDSSLSPVLFNIFLEKNSESLEEEVPMNGSVNQIK